MDGFVFICTNETEAECFERKLFGTSQKYAEPALKVRKGQRGFLLNIQSDVLFGSFTAASDCVRDIDTMAWRGAFPYQVRVEWAGIKKVGNARTALRKAG